MEKRQNEVTDEELKKLADVYLGLNKANRLFALSSVNLLLASQMEEEKRGLVSTDPIPV